MHGKGHNMTLGELIEDMRDDLISLGYKSSLEISYYEADSNNPAGYSTQLKVSNRKVDTEFIATGFSTFFEYSELLTQALVFVKESSEPNRSLNIGSVSDKYSVRVDSFQMGDMPVDGYYESLIEALQSGWSFTDSVSLNRFRHVVVSRKRWGKYATPTHFPLVAKTGADFNILIPKLISKAMKAYEEHPDEIVYMNIYGEIKVDKALSKAIQNMYR